MGFALLLFAARNNAVPLGPATAAIHARRWYPGINRRHRAR